MYVQKRNPFKKVKPTKTNYTKRRLVFIWGYKGYGPKWYKRKVFRG